MLKHTVAKDIKETPVSTYLRRAYPAIPQFALREALKKRDVRIAEKILESKAHKL